MTMRTVSTAFIVISVLFLIVVIGIVIGISTYHEPTAEVNLGPVAQFPLGSVTALQLPAAFSDPMYRFDGQQPPVPIGRVAPIPIFLVHTLSGSFVALYNRDTHSTCKIRWVEAHQEFEDLCHGARYTRTGEYRGGPAPRGLDRFAVEITAPAMLW
jgi:Rieske Fe-S protein